MSEKHLSENEIELDFDKLARVGSKINELLIKRTKGLAEAYAILRFLCVYYEMDLGIAFQPEFEAELRSVVKKSIEGEELESDSSKSP